MEKSIWHRKNPVLYGYIPVLCDYILILCGFIPVPCGYIPVQRGFILVPRGNNPVPLGYIPKKMLYENDGRPKFAPLSHARTSLRRIVTHPSHRRNIKSQIHQQPLVG